MWARWSGPWSFTKVAAHVTDQAVLDAYKSNPKKSTLKFSDLDITPLSPTAAMVFGRFHNNVEDGTYKTGLFTLLMRKIDGQWKAVHDHSSDLPSDYKPK